MSDPIKAKLEQARYAVRRHLYARPAVSQSADTLAHMLYGEQRLSVEEVRNAAEFLAALGHLKRTVAALGSSIYYKITPQGILAHERED